ncbi:MAG: porphobilinogen deaminase [Vezdaea aestivalis]|nr:MAG: porphobilinogen deaminase [Vezdaea aestivalis]
MADQGTQPDSSAPATNRPTVHIGTRKSVLALKQTDIVHQALLALYPTYSFEIHAMSTMGDKNQTTALHSFGAKSLWTHELEALLLDGTLDLIVHSLKDMPTTLPEGCCVGAVLKREDPRDALVMSARLAGKYSSLAALPAGSVVGTSSVRRSAQIARRYPHLKFADVRGNVGTRLAKLDHEQGVYSCLVLAAAGLKRLGLGDRITGFLEGGGEKGGIMYAVGQGALGIEIRTGDERVREMIGRLEDEGTARACLAERALMRKLEGGCSVPVGVETSWQEKQRMRMAACVVSLDGREGVEVEEEAEVTSKEQAEVFGERVAEKLVQGGAGTILKAINDKKEAGGKETDR